MEYFFSKFKSLVEARECLLFNENSIMQCIKNKGNALIEFSLCCIY